MMTANDHLIVVDMQNDFIDGALGTPEAQAIVDKVVQAVESFEGTVLFTRDTHESDYLSTQEGQKLPVEHCIEGTSGWELAAPLQKIVDERDLTVYDKDTFAALEMAIDLGEENLEHPISSITLIGLCTDICVVSNALMLKGFMPEVPIKVNASLCAGVSPNLHEAALDTMRSCQIEIV